MTVTLTKPVERTGTDPITEVSLRKPSVGELRGVKLNELVRMDVSTMLVVLPRVTQPPLLTAEVAAMDPADFLELSLQLLGFFMDEKQMQAAQEAAQLG